MQRYCTELTDRLLKSLDKEYNVVDMGAVVDVITALEKTTITKEVLEITRLGKYINELRRKTNNDALAKRAKDLVRKWRDMVLPSSHTTSSHPPPPSQQQSTPQESTSQQTVNGAMIPLSPTTRIVKSRSPIPTRIIKPQSPSLHDIVPSMKVLSPALSLNSEHSRSPNLTPMKQLPTTMIVSNCRINSSASPILSGTNQNHSIEAVPRTHSSNKRLRKDENSLQLSPLQQQQQQLCDIGSTLRDELAIAKKPRVNGDNVNFSINSQVPSSPLSTPRDKISLEFINNSEIDVGPKKRGRKKGSKSLKQQPLPEDRVKEKLASISRNPKLKTTQELLADLQARGSNVGSGGDDSVGVGNLNHSIIGRRTITEPPTTEEILRSTANISNHGLGGSGGVSGTSGAIDQINIMKITQSNSNKLRGESRVPNVELLESNNMQPLNSTVEEILAKLPPLDLDSIRWSDDEETAVMNGDDLIDNDKNMDYEERQPRQINDRDVDRLHENCIEGLNGNFQLTDIITTDKKKCDETHMELTHNPTESAKKIVDVYKRRIVDDGTNRKFREWHEMLARPSYDGQILHILPYVIID